MTESQITDHAHRAAQGDADALQRLIVHHHQRLHGTIRSWLDGRFQRYFDTEDVLQWTYADAFRAVDACSFDGPGGFYAWLVAIAQNRLAMMKRDLKRQKRDVRREVHDGSRAPAGNNGESSYPGLFARLSDSGSTPSRRVARREAEAMILSSIARLTDDQRAVIRMRFIQDCPPAEIAAALGKSEDAVYAACSRGLKSLRAYMGSISQYWPMK